MANFLRLMYLKLLIEVGLTHTLTSRLILYPNIIETNNKTKFCVHEYSSIDTQSKLPVLRNRTYKLTNYLDLDATEFCNENNGKHGLDSMAEQIVLIKHSSECDVNKQINYFRNQSIVGLILSIECNISIRKDINVTKETVLDNKFSISLIAKSNSKQIQIQSPKQLKMFDIKFVNDYHFAEPAIFWCLSMLAIVVGAFWSGRVRLKKFMGKHTLTSEQTNSSSTNNPVKEVSFIDLSIIQVFGLVLLAPVILLLIFCFYKYVIYFVILIFAVTSMVSVSGCLQPIAKKVLPYSLIKHSIRVFETNIASYKYCTFAIGICLTIVWFVTRHDSHSWILHDMLGVAVCLFAIKTIRLPSFKICLILLWSFFFYDVFMVFGTPLFFDGRSVMVDAATGGEPSVCNNLREMNPMLLRVHQNDFHSDDLSLACFPNAQSIIGFGDIVLPGLLVAYCYAFDLMFNHRIAIYFIISSIGYGIGLIVTYIALEVMKKGQPALLYLVPFTSIPIILTGLIRNEWHSLWIGPERNFYSQMKQSMTDDDDDKQKTQNQ